MDHSPWSMVLNREKKFILIAMDYRLWYMDFPNQNPN